MPAFFPGRQRFFTFEGKDWYPINVDGGSTAEDAISVEAWTTLSEAPGSLADGPAAPSSSEVSAQARAENLDIFQCCICFCSPQKPVIFERPGTSPRTSQGHMVLSALQHRGARVTADVPVELKAPQALRTSQQPIYMQPCSAQNIGSWCMSVVKFNPIRLNET
ncbi:hypothetical protein C8J57DRAFT_1255950 [Mycena rebaudengoi]|nr:hypothetical protein C8J57DRAFT_1255950 [Mycena rebaudengoi]